MKWHSCLVRIGLVLLLWLFTNGTAQASTLSARLQQFPNWQGKLSVPTANGDLVYPSWFVGEWTVTTTLVDLVAPLAPNITTPGFNASQQYLNQPVTFRVRFAEAQCLHNPSIVSIRSPLTDPDAHVVADRAFNGLNLAKAYLGNHAIYSVKVDPKNPNRQITLLPGDRQLITTITKRATETPEANQFFFTEIFQQQFRGAGQLYFNEVEATTAYQNRLSNTSVITANQVTAIYLSPQDQDYFRAGNRPVALYYYRLEFTR